MSGQKHRSRHSPYLGVPVKTLYDWRTKGYGPEGKRVGKYVPYKPDDVIAWFESLDDHAA
ncbi:helix-turn-helix domain-containing protein [Prauserella flavalba]|uniref:Excisionase n=1 Tax=Prauserella flavalba TaxID=1477506 RepID=A0A318LIB5_9PSEU|nr:helix-turn-helix domain-containing protein [Prauserella flavalba]PXY21874.1 excisionase [Prauserella flavalba]